MTTATPTTVAMKNGHTAWVKWLTWKEMAVMPSGLAPTPLSISSTCGTIFTCEMMNAPTSTAMITPGVMVAFLSCFWKNNSLFSRVASDWKAWWSWPASEPAWMRPMMVSLKRPVRRKASWTLIPQLMSSRMCNMASTMTLLGRPWL